MYKIKNKYKIISVLLVYGFVIHFFALHFLFENNILCRINGKVFVEKIDANGNCEHKSEFTGNVISLLPIEYCEDVLFANHLTDNYRAAVHHNLKVPDSLPAYINPEHSNNKISFHYKKEFNRIDIISFPIVIKSTTSLLI